MSSQKRGFGQRINNWLYELPGETFRHGKWRFWFVALIAFSILNAVLTAVVFNAGGVLQNYMGSVLLGVGALLAWLGLGALHYSDSADPHLSRGVAVLDSVTLLFVVTHFSFLLWVYGHLTTLQRAEADHKVEIERFNVKIEKFNVEARQVQADNARIADALQSAAESEKEKAKIEQDTAYQLRQAARHGAKIQKSGGITANIQLAPVELAKPPEPPKPPKDSSADYLTRWDSWIRLANFGELALAIFTLIFIRVRSSLTNSPREEDFPSEIEVNVAERRSSRRGDLILKTTTHDDRLDDTHSERKTTRGTNPPGLRELRECLKLIAFNNPPGHFKADVRDDYVIIRSMASDRGDQHTVHSTKASLSLLDDALTMKPDAFRERLEEFLRKRNFEL